MFFDGKTITINGYQDTKILKQVDWARQSMEHWLSAQVPVVAIKSIVVFPGRWVDEDPAHLGSGDTVWVLNEKRVCDLIKKQQEILTAQQVDRAASVLRKYCCPDLSQ